ncbi:MAG TPA: polysaccharide deacetylase family protein [Acidobacteriaceae bacterium]|nr:polysaccharide deacetylase family protein [Acidobacteriaceae bacterium]
MGFAATAAAQQIAITFDDLPAHGPLPPHETRLQIANRVTQALKAAHVPPTYGFVNGVRVQEDPSTGAVLAAWRSAGYPLGNHTFSHMNLNQHSPQQFEDDIAKNEPLLKLQMDGADWHWLRFPYLAEGDTIEKKMGVRVWLAQHGYQIAGVTMTFADYNWNEPYARCMEKHDARAVTGLEHGYLEAARQSITYYRNLSQILYGHDIPYVLLMHIGAFDARMLPRLLQVYKQHGFTFVSLQDAERDPFYKYDTDPRLVPGPDMLEGVMADKHWALPPHPDWGGDLASVCK